MRTRSAIAGGAVVTAAELEQPAVAELLAGERLRSVSLESRLLLAAARMALRDARGRTHGPHIDADELGVVVATRHAGLQDYVELFREGTEGERPRVRPAKGPQSGLTAPAAEVSIRLPAAGPNATVSNGCVGGFDALRYAADRLSAGDASAMLVCEVDVTPDLLRATPAPDEQDPPAARAAAVVLEPEPAVRARGAVPCALLGAVATAFSPAGDAAEAQARASGEALATVGVEAGEAHARDAGAPLAQLVAAVADLARAGVGDPLLLQAHDDGSAGAAVVHREPARSR